MRLPRLNQRRALGLVVVGLLVTSLLPPGAARVVSAPPRHLLETAVGFVSMPLKAAADAVRGDERLSIDRGDPTLLEQNYDAQLAYNRKLESELVRLREELDRYRVARRQSGLRNVDFVFADVLAWSTGPARQSLTLNVGTRQGVRVGQVVTDSAGFALVGRVTDAGPSSSSLTLITSMSHLEVKFKPSTPTVLPVEPPVFGIRADRATGRFTLEAKADSPIRVGYLAHLEDPAWPTEAQGRVVGKVVSVTPLDTDPLRFVRVAVQPVQPLANLGRVTVIVPAEP